EQWEVLTETDRLPVRLPPGDPVDANYEMWSSVRLRLCDGVTERMKGTPCVCPADLMERKQLAQTGGACKPTTRLSLILADLPGLGVWTLTSTGDSAADELAATAELLERAALNGVMLPATLRLEQREARGSGELHRYAVPVLDVAPSLVALESGQFTPAGALTTGTERAALPAGAPVEIPETSAAAAVERPAATEPIGAPKTPQAIADLARKATTTAMVKQLGAYGRERGWLEEFVADRDGISEPLENALYTELERLGGIQG
ncbi:MAG: hypothetical protein M3N21_08845, partial [Actinomycetota bacterium]|nr:hypothetical protein [Actinomycetota bacterium]